MLVLGNSSWWMTRRAPSKMNLGTNKESSYQKLTKASLTWNTNTRTQHIGDEWKKETSERNRGRNSSKRYGQKRSKTKYKRLKLDWTGDQSVKVNWISKERKIEKPKTTSNYSKNKTPRTLNRAKICIYQFDDKRNSNRNTVCIRSGSGWA